MKMMFKHCKCWKLLVYCCLYFFCVVIFASFYYLLFISNTASFYISEEYNEKVNGRFAVHSPEILYDIVDRSDNPFGIDDFNQRIKPINDSISSIYEELESLRTYTDFLERKREKLSSRFSDSRTEEIDRYRNDQLRLLRDSITAYEQSLEDSLRFGITEEQLVLNGSYVHLANMNYRFAQRNLSVSTAIVDNLVDFGSREIADSLQNTVKAILETSIRIETREGLKKNLFREYYSNLSDFHEQRIDKVNFGDFIHFSLLIATSNSFGDILPNSSIARTLVSLQLIVGIVLLAFILNDLTLYRKK